MDGTAALRGRIMASFDVSRGQYQMLVYGEPGPHQDEFLSVLRERYGIEHRRVAGCLVSSELMEYAESYDTVMEAAVKRRFGRDVYRETYDEVLSRWDPKHKPATGEL